MIEDIGYIDTKIPESEVIENLEEEVKRLKAIKLDLEHRIEKAANYLYDGDDDSSYNALCALGFER